MSADRTTEILNYLSAMTRDIADMRAAIARDIAETRASLEARIGKVEAELRAVVTRLDRIESTVLQTRANILENRADARYLEDRVAALESK